MLSMDFDRHHNNPLTLPLMRCYQCVHSLPPLAYTTLDPLRIEPATNGKSGRINPAPPNDDLQTPALTAWPAAAQIRPPAAPSQSAGAIMTSPQRRKRKVHEARTSPDKGQPYRCQLRRTLSCREQNDIQRRPCSHCDSCDVSVRELDSALGDERLLCVTLTG